MDDIFTSVLLALGKPSFPLRKDYVAEFDRHMALNGYGPQYDEWFLFSKFLHFCFGESADALLRRNYL